MVLGFGGEPAVPALTSNPSKPMSQNTDKTTPNELSDDQLEEAAGGCLIIDPKIPIEGPRPFPYPILVPEEPVPGPTLPPDLSETH